ncbi:MAG: hypothetical protein IJN14_01590 [Ruminococcus sp.]|nr:hypothetical protein [Ruminococcus sp.]
MKKIITAVIAAVTLLSCAGCSLKKDSSDTDNKQKISALKVGNPVVPEIEKEVIWETDRIRVSTEFFKRAETGLKIKIENKSNTDLQLVTGVSSLYVNDCAFTDLMFADVPAGETLCDTIELYSSIVREYGIEEIHRVEFSLEAEYNGDFTDKEKSDTIIVGDKSDEWRKDFKAPDGQLLWDSDGIKIISLGFSGEIIPVLSVYIENNTGKEIDAHLTWADVNGLDVDLLSKSLHGYIQNGKKRICQYDMDEIMKESGEDSLKVFGLNFDIDIGEDDSLRTRYLNIKDISGYTYKPSETTTEKEED